jgi:hypothetical protein
MELKKSPSFPGFPGRSSPVDPFLPVPATRIRDLIGQNAASSKKTVSYVLFRDIREYSIVDQNDESFSKLFYDIFLEVTDPRFLFF